MVEKLEMSGLQGKAHLHDIPEVYEPVPSAPMTASYRTVPALGQSPGTPVDTGLVLLIHIPRYLQQHVQRDASVCANSIEQVL
jgi:hypothetical protein